MVLVALVALALVALALDVEVTSVARLTARIESPFAAWTSCQMRNRKIQPGNTFHTICVIHDNGGEQPPFLVHNA